MDRVNCSVKNCINTAAPGDANRYCHAHRSRVYRHGDVLADVPLKQSFASRKAHQRKDLLQRRTFEALNFATIPKEDNRDFKGYNPARYVAQTFK